MNRLLVFPLLIVVIIATAVIVTHQQSSEQKINCRGEVSIKRNADRLNLVAAQQLNGGDGTLSLSGVLYEGHDIAGYLSKTVSFTYDRDEDFYRLKSGHIINSPQMTLPADKERAWLPTFFIDEGTPHTLEIKPYGNHSWLIYSHTVPLFICEKNL
ncbi:hypothetical protein [Erwinia piriflorinigrans]|uniref:Uncharacterized protein n=1 Tax=Erwinia piriflorinigrans CFBP 5888 TaxID=1161919 RepID=V5ZD88_9GAMM|nr:hypothetical protein [Erwinia piriflorinigrans]CCG88974.1 hypothetical protein EPIR_3611 [Erwinia piriflorinigrans CFBP 5888]